MPVTSLACGVVGLAFALMPPLGIIGVVLALGAVLCGWATLRAPSVRDSSAPSMAICGLLAGLLTISVFGVSVVTESLERDRKEDEIRQLVIKPYALDGECDAEHIETDPDC
jgi:hypothetical protein